MGAKINFITSIIVALLTTIISFFALKYFTSPNMDYSFEKYLLENPSIIIKSVEKYQQAELEKSNNKYKEALLNNKKEIYEDASSPFIGNPEGSIEIVEFFDYSCHYCKKIFPILARLLQEEKELKVIMKELPILGELSVLKSKASLALYSMEKDNILKTKDINQQKYFEFHKKLIETKIFSQKDIENIATNLEIDFDELNKKMQEADISEIITKNNTLAVKLGIRGTPALIINDQIIPGALSYEELKSIISNMK